MFRALRWLVLAVVCGLAGYGTAAAGPGAYGVAVIDPLQLAERAAPAVSSANQCLVYANSVTHVLYQSCNGGAWTAIMTAAVIGNWTTGIVAGTAIDVSGVPAPGWTPQVDWDSTEVNSTTWGDGTLASFTGTYNVSVGVDPIITYGNGTVNVSTGTLQQAGTAVVLQTRNLTAGVGLSGGGDLSADRTFTFDPTEVDSKTWSNGAQASIVDTYNVSVGVDPIITYGNGTVNVSTGTLQQAGTAVVLQTRNLTAGVGLSGGGDLSADRTFTFDPTEVDSKTWSNGAQASIVDTYNVSGTDTTVTYGSALATFSHGLAVNGAVTLGDAVGDTVLSNATAYTFPADTTYTGGGGTNAHNWCSNLWSLDCSATPRVGIGTAAPAYQLEQQGSGNILFYGNYTGSGTITGGSTGSGMYLALAAGFAGAGGSAVLTALNYTTQTATTWNTGGYYYPDANRGAIFNARGTTVGQNVGVEGYAYGGNLNVGGFFNAVTAKNSATNVGLVGIGRNTGSSPVQIGGFFSLGGAVAAVPVWGASTALVADNVDQASAIFDARDNGTSTFLIADSGAITSTGATWTISNDLAVTLSGGVNGINFDSNTLSIDASNHRVGVNTATPAYTLDVVGTAAASVAVRVGTPTVGFGTTTGSVGVVNATQARLDFGTDVSNYATLAATAASDMVSFGATGMGLITATNYSVAGLNLSMYSGADAAGEYGVVAGTSSTATAQTDFAVANDVDGTPVYVLKVVGTGEVILPQTVTAATACAAGTVGTAIMYGVGNTISFCVCQKTGAATYAYAGLTTGTCPP